MQLSSHRHVLGKTPDAPHWPNPELHECGNDPAMISKKNNHCTYSSTSSLHGPNDMSKNSPLSYSQSKQHEANKTQSASSFSPSQLGTARHEHALLEALRSSRGYLVPLRTLAEVQSTLQLEDAYIVRIPAKAADTVLK